jgi:hypothetical protein
LALQPASANAATARIILVESVRVNGKPRQKHVAFLGSIELDDPRATIGDSDHARFWRDMIAKGKARFWRDVISRLKRLGNRVGPEDRKRIAAAIAAKVGEPPTEAELQQLEREREQFLAWLSGSPVSPTGESGGSPGRARDRR